MNVFHGRKHLLYENYAAKVTKRIDTAVLLSYFLQTIRFKRFCGQQR
ncbi:hypothetical protein HMPREF0658_0991 [Hoylesella marshii DSM 16973 = JCM 13450]|uniref:Uncharacterized protein n=1 Tax=Hoylesella marshii DSM 16973 = JCM 13450 TaxID=862515 RepID=E0NS40_9BACT|nr:hypothetical protein HMPREF0658_0991 [Hoylesella marshii DSM 16973 = JCM 13450]